MPNDLLTELVNLIVSAGMVAVLAIPILLLCWFVDPGTLTLKRFRFWRTRDGWSGAELLLLFGSTILAPAAIFGLLDGVGFFQWWYGPGFPRQLPEAAAGGAVAGAAGVAGAREHLATLLELRGVWGTVLGQPIVIALAGFLTILAGHGRSGSKAQNSPGWPPRTALGIIAWPFVSLVVYAIYAIALSIMYWLGESPDPHPLSRLDLTADTVTLFAVGLLACLVAPVVEEIIFRGVAIDWAEKHPAYPLVLIVLAPLLASTSLNLFAIGFAVCLLVAYPFIPTLTHIFGLTWTQRSVASVYASGALFAAAHSTVWPSPVPLFALALMLGWLRIRTNGILSGVVVHVLFNAVAFAQILGRGSL